LGTRTLVVAADSRSQTGTSRLTPREQEVARLAAQGLTNRQIAQALVIAEKTAANHLQHVLEKLALHTRTQLAARAGELGLAPGGAAPKPCVY
jgi:DNA-binding NarL/FixJ family response regulator